MGRQAAIMLLRMSLYLLHGQRNDSRVMGRGETGVQTNIKLDENETLTSGVSVHRQTPRRSGK